MFSNISNNDANDDMAALYTQSKAVNTKKLISGNHLLSLPNDILFEIFQYLISTKRDVSNFEKTSKTMFALVNNSNLAYNVWLMFGKRAKLSTISATQPMQIREEIKTLHLHATWKMAMV